MRVEHTPSQAINDNIKAHEAKWTSVTKPENFYAYNDQLITGNKIHARQI
jgi:hypothetical protein